MHFSGSSGLRIRAGAIALAALFVASPAGVATAQISGIERGGGIDRPYVPQRKRMTTRIVPTRRDKPSPREPKVIDPPDTISISAEAKSHYDAGRNAFDRSDFDVAIREFEAAIRLESKFIDAIIDLGDSYFELAQVEDAADTYQRALVVDRGNIDAQFRLGRASYARKDYDTALKAYNDVLKAKPNDAEAIYNIALTNKALKRYEAAIPFFERAINARATPFPEARVNLSRCYYELGKLAEAEAEAQKAINEIGPDRQASANAWYALATARAKAPNLPGATEALQKAIDVCKDCPEDMLSRFYLPLANVLEARGNRTEAAAAYERFLVLAPFVAPDQVAEIRERISKLRAPR